MVPRHVASGGDFVRHPADPLPQVQVVRRLVQQHAAALPDPGSPPFPAVIVVLGAVPVGYDPHASFDFPEPAPDNQRPRFLKNGVCPLVQHDREHLSRSLSCFNRFAGGGKADVQRLFTQHVKAGLQGLYGHHAVQRMGHGDHHSVGFSGSNQLMIVGKNPYPRQFRFRPGEAGRPKVAYSGKAHAGDRPGMDAPRMGAAHISDSDHGSAENIIHVPMAPLQHRSQASPWRMLVSRSPRCPQTRRRKFPFCGR